MIARTAIDRAAQALDAIDTATQQGDRAAADRAAADAAVWWTVAQAQGATPADVRAHRAGGAR
ncbi:hypothetical protein [Streptomyces sp. ISL-100]|uniref:hypothetical protein n=1 Tax=Streptomyces sp. ISL-100 TaxID=2819173 RepID=UPI001BEA078A|nr:hypothetical protein [Streptomyces sp. ISL-100]MBT2397235.1 hypothetical protein [Streptomyces sp. ISL-100]